MARSKLGSLLEQKINKVRAEILESIGTGVCVDYPHYRDQCGYVRGLEDALAIVAEIEAKE